MAALVGVVTAFAAVLWTYWGYEFLYSQVWWSSVTLNVPLSQAGGGRPEGWYRPETGPYYFVVIASMILATGGAAALLILTPRPQFRTRALIYLVFLAILLPASWYNYNQKDLVLPALLQAGLNLGLIFLGATIASWLSGVPASHTDLRVLKFMTLTSLTFAAVVVPALFTGIYALWAIKVIPRQEPLTFAQLTGLAGLISAAIGILNYRRELRKETSALTSAEARVRLR